VLCAAVAGIVLAATPARAASFSSIIDKNGKTWVMVNGIIKPGDRIRLVDLLDSLSRARRFMGFILNSDGGNVVEASKIARGARSLGVTTYVADNYECSSACFLIWAAGKYRLASPTASIGVHSISIYGQETLDTKAHTIDQARELAMDHVSPAVIGKLTSTTPDGIAWLTAKDLDSMDVQIVASNGAPVPLSAQ